MRTMFGGTSIEVWAYSTPRYPTRRIFRGRPGLHNLRATFPVGNCASGLDPKSDWGQRELTATRPTRRGMMTEPSRASAPTDVRYHTVLKTITAIALAAGERVMEVYGRDFDVAIKPDASPVTEADMLAEALIVERLGAAFPDIAIIAEEAVANGDAPECGDQFFLVDPLDGSKEFIARNCEFTVNIALISSGSPVAGVVYAPALGRVWWGAGAVGAWVGEVLEGVITSQAAIAVRAAPELGLTLVCSRSHGSEGKKDRLSAFALAESVAVGSSLKFCLLAEGEADLYPRFGRTMEWDTAAGDAILRAAGGQVLDLDGAPLRYGKRDQTHDCDFANTHFWAFGDAAHLAPIVFKDRR